MPAKVRELQILHSGQRVIDGNGVNITRFIGLPDLNMLDPFLLFDMFESDQASDYIGGFPSHPHRGFETVTYLLAGSMRHKDSAGHEGVIGPGGVQWMTAGKGIVHSEMPEQDDGLLQGFQLWVNLPAKYKMQNPSYQEFSADQIALERLDNRSEIRVISGKTLRGTTGPVVNHYVNSLYLDISLPEGQIFEQPVSVELTVLLYVVEGQISIANKSQAINHHQLAVLGTGDYITLTAQTRARFLMIAGQPLKEPVARGGPFVMNTKAEVLQAFKDLQNDEFLGD